VARVYLSLIRERKEREWLYCRGMFPSMARGWIAWPWANFLLLTLGIGAIYRRRVRSSEDYFL
jgi:hypothetical protein